jgi:putative acetyltransferase
MKRRREGRVSVSVKIRDEQPGDAAAIFAVNQAAFGRPDEARLVDALRADGAATVSLVAELDGEVVGHILFSEVTLDPPRSVADVIALAPVAVRPDLQSRRIGAALIEEGLRRCGKLGYGAAVLLGPPSYYPRFGFLPAHRFGLRCEFPSPPEAFMALELAPGGLEGEPATVHYHAAFRGV